MVLITSSATRLGPEDLKAQSIVSPGPAMKPSSDIVMCQTTRLTARPPIRLAASLICCSVLPRPRWWGFGAFSATHTHHLAKGARARGP